MGEQNVPIVIAKVGSAITCDLAGHGNRVWLHRAAYEEEKQYLFILQVLQTYFWYYQFVRQTQNGSWHLYLENSVQKTVMFYITSCNVKLQSCFFTCFSNSFNASLTRISQDLCLTLGVERTSLHSAPWDRKLAFLVPHWHSRWHLIATQRLFDLRKLTCAFLGEETVS